MRAIARAIELFEIVSPGIRVVGGVGDVRTASKPAPQIRVTLDWLIRKLGRPLEAAEVRRILSALQFGIEEPESGVFDVTVPSWRATKDISIKDDVLEEIGRMVGYDTITPQAPLVPTAAPPANPRRLFLRGIRQLVSAQGFDEVYNYSFLSEDMARKFGLEPSAHVEVANPISVEQSLLRQTLIPGIWRNLEENAKHFDSFRLFEIGFEIHKQSEGLPLEVPHIAAAMWTKAGEPGTLFELKRLAECVLPGCEVRPAEARLFEHPSRTGNVLWREKVVGRLFEFHPRFVEKGRAVVLDIDLGIVESMAGGEKRFRPIRRFPSSSFDLSIVAVSRTLVGDLRRELTGKHVESVEFLMQYEGAPLPAGKKSVSFRVTVAAADHTLTTEEVNVVREEIVGRLQSAGYDLRV